MTRSPSQRLEAGQQDTRAQILSAAADAFVVGGFSGTSIDDVADLLGATKGLVYHYFKSKTDLYLAVLQRGVDGLLATLENAATTDAEPHLKLSTMVRAHVSYFSSERSSMLLLAQSLFSGLPKSMSDRQRMRVKEIGVSRDRILHVYMDLIAAGTRAGAFVDAQPDVVTRMVLGGIIVAVLQPDHADGDFEVAADAIAQFMVRAVARPSDQPSRLSGPGRR